MADLKLIPEKVADKDISFSDLLVAGVLKYGVERVSAPVIGNGTIGSGVIKMVAGQYGAKYVPVVGKNLRLGLLIDSTEDIVNGVMSVLIGGAPLQSQLPAFAQGMIGGNSSNNNSQNTSIVI